VVVAGYSQRCTGDVRWHCPFCMTERRAGVDALWQERSFDAKDSEHCVPRLASVLIHEASAGDE
jgi:hypothetical protein